MDVIEIKSWNHFVDETNPLGDWVFRGQVNEDWKRHGLNSEVAVVFNVERKIALIFGTWYGGENKKGIFSLMNYWLPMQGQFPMRK